MGTWFSVNAEALRIKGKTEFKSPGARGVRHFYYKVEAKDLDAKSLREQDQDLYVTAQAQDGLLKGVYFAEDGRFPVESARVAFKHQSSGPGRRKELRIRIQSARLRDGADYWFTVSVFPRPKRKTIQNGREVTAKDDRDVQVAFLITAVPARPSVHIVFETDAEAKSTRTVDFHPPVSPMDAWDIGLEFKPGTTEVSEVGDEGQARREFVKSGWRVVEVNNQVMDGKTLSSVWQKVLASCKAVRNVDRLKTLEGNAGLGESQAVESGVAGDSKQGGGSGGGDAKDGKEEKNADGFDV